MRRHRLVGARRPCKARRVHSRYVRNVVAQAFTPLVTWRVTYLYGAEWRRFRRRMRECYEDCAFLTILAGGYDLMTSDPHIITHYITCYVMFDWVQRNWDE
jgi:hypothetical protein